MDPVQNLIACAEMATKNALECLEEAAKATTPEREEYWKAEVDHAEYRANFYLERAKEMQEFRNVENGVAA